MIDALKRVFDLAAQQSDEEQAALATILLEAMEADARWAELFADPLTPDALDLLAAEAFAEDDAGLTEEIKGDSFLS
ncbi:MAG TPA: hypothetical protein VKQ36_10515 [Ktedonobacterales bacterium]|nr:hypothetical protein [Ktedonobacterales bacterium]